MHDSLIEGKKYKVRLKPLEELLEGCPEGGDTLFADDEDCWDVEAEHHTTNSQGEGLCKWFSRYLDGGLGVLHFSWWWGRWGGAPSSDAVVVWDVDGDAWYYQWGQLKVLGRFDMVDELVEGKTYKVRLRPLEELEQEVDTVGGLGEAWFRDYVDGQVGVLHYGGEKPEWDTYMVRWEGDFWYYRLGCLKVLGEL